jgi:hypothetical protein
MAKKSEGVPAPSPKVIACQKLAPGERADLGVTDTNAYKNQYAKQPPVNDREFEDAFTKMYL